jgi:hypothetical protein
MGEDHVGFACGTAMTGCEKNIDRVYRLMKKERKEKRRHVSK